MGPCHHTCLYYLPRQGDLPVPCSSLTTFAVTAWKTLSVNSDIWTLPKTLVQPAFFSLSFSYTFLFLCIIACSFWWKPNIKCYIAVTLALLTGPVVIVLFLLFSCSVMSESLWPHGLQHARLPCPSPSSGACSNSCPLSRWCHPTISSSVVPFSSCLQTLNFRVFSNESAVCIRWPKYWSFSFSISPSNAHSGLISFRIDWFDLLIVQGALKSLVQHHSSKASILLHSAFFIVQLSYPYMTTGKTIALTRRTFVSIVMSLFFNMLSRFVIAFLPRSKRLLISWLQLPSAVILKPQKIKSLTVSIVFPSICHEVMGPDAMILVFWMLSFKPAFSRFSFTLIKRLLGLAWWLRG